MARKTKTRVQLIAERDKFAIALGEARGVIADQRVTISGLEGQVISEQMQRVAAQRGLVPYVRALHLFDDWLRERPSMREQLEGILKELGLWNIRIAYDPDRDIGLSVASPNRR